MDLSYVKKLIKLLSDSEVDEIEIEEEGKKVRVVKHAGNSRGNPTMHISPQPQSMPSQGVVYAPPSPIPPGATPAEVPDAQKKLHEIKSPIVGTFYKAPAPDAAPFVDVGSVIQVGSVLCIVEAMKLMNEIESDISGRIAKVMVQNGQAVEYGQTLFLVEPA